MELQDLLGSLDEAIHLVGPHFHFSSIQGMPDSDFSLLGFPLDPLDGSDAVLVLVAVTAMWD